jgi:hypothetical protein
MLAARDLKSVSEVVSDVNNKYSDIISSDDSIAKRKQMKDNLAREFENYYKLNQQANFEFLKQNSNGGAIENLSGNNSLNQSDDGAPLFRQTSIYGAQTILGKREARIQEVQDPLIETTEKRSRL